jgi:UDP-N-acetylglucosamine acyltransferase
MPNIHPTAIVDPQVQLADDVTVGPYCSITGPVTIGPGCRLISHVVIMGRTTIGANNTFWPFSVIGGDPQDLKFKGEDSELIIGDHNDIREHVTIHKGTANGGNVTRVGSHNLIMIGSHVGHDCMLGSHLIMANTVQLAGHVRVEDYAIISGASAVHSFVTIGPYAYIGGATRVARDVPPYMVFEGNPSAVRSVNVVGLSRRQFPEETIDRLKDAFRLLFKPSADGSGVGRTTEHLANLERHFPDDPHIMLLVNFIRNSAKGMHGRYLEAHRKDSRYHNPVK